MHFAKENTKTRVTDVFPFRWIKNRALAERIQGDESVSLMRNFQNRQDMGYIKYKNGGRYDGELKEGVRNGYGVYQYARGRRYVGFWSENKREGRGVFYYPGGANYSGDFQDNLPHGFGVFTWPDGVKFVGEWSRGLPDGLGQIIHPDGETLQGRYRRGRLVRGEGLERYRNRETGDLVRNPYRSIG